MMPQIVIVGAGPVGLHLALTLERQGVAAGEILIVDPRAGHYTRPGHLLSGNFNYVYNSLGLLPWLKRVDNDNGHIKDLERELYSLASEKKIRFIQSSFQGFVKAAEGQAYQLLLQDSAGKKKHVQCSYLFECSGIRRAVVQAVNRHVETQGQEAIFRLSSIAEVRIQRHFLAYVRLTAEDDELFDPGVYLYNSLSLEEQMSALLKLWDLGWRHFRLPLLYGQRFGKRKSCLYVELPDNCPEEKALDWLSLMMAIVAKKEAVPLELLPASKKWGEKPRLQVFHSNPRKINRSKITGLPGLPKIFICGDASDEPCYHQGYGITNGADRNVALVASMNISDGRIQALDEKAYQKQVFPLRQQHWKEIQDYFEKTNDNLRKKAQELERFSFTIDEKSPYKAIVKQAGVYNEYYELLPHLFAHLNRDGSFALDEIMFRKDISFISAQKELSALLKSFDPQMPEREAAEVLLKQIMQAWISLAKLKDRTHLHSKALFAYQQAFDIAYALISSKDVALEVELLLNIIIKFLRMDKIKDAYKTGVWTIALLQKYPPDTCPDIANKVKTQMLHTLLKWIPQQGVVDAKEGLKRYAWLLKNTTLTKDLQLLFEAEYENLQIRYSDKFSNNHYAALMLPGGTQ